tara:strand:- start:289 stop:690 length:402 start_codon:yes stop_codon:yes gene_type:complete
MITDGAKRKMALFIKEFYTHANVGAGGDSTNPNSNSLDVPIISSNQSTTNSASDAATIDFTVSLTGSQLEGNTIREFAIFGSTPNDAEMANLSSGSWNTGNVETIMLSRINFNGVGPFSSSDQIDLTLTVEVE